jgi:hypothetical protein
LAGNPTDKQTQIRINLVKFAKVKKGLENLNTILWEVPG